MIIFNDKKNINKFSNIKAVYYVLEKFGKTFKIINYESNFDFLYNYFNNKNFYCSSSNNISYGNLDSLYKIDNFEINTNNSYKITINGIINNNPFNENEMMFIFSKEKVYN